MRNALAIAVLAVAACGGSDGTPSAGGTTGGTSVPPPASKDVSRFTGTPWTVHATISVSCPGRAPLVINGSTTATYDPGTGGADVQYTTRTSGCLFKFTVDSTGTTATLSNAPVICSFTDQTGAVIVQTTTSEVDTTSDGHHLTVTASGMLSSGGGSCPYGETDSGTR